MIPAFRSLPPSPTLSLVPASLGRRMGRKVGLGLLTAVLWVSCLAAEAIRLSFDLPEDSIEKSLKRFSAQSGLEVIFPTDTVTGTRTKAVRGAMTARQALDGMLAGTGFLVFQDEKTGAITVKKSAPKKAAASPRGSTTSVEPSPLPKVETPTPSNPPMKKSSLVARLSAIIGLSVSAQADAQVPAPDEPAKKAEAEKAVILSPFEVTSAGDTGYAASSALTGTRTNEKLANIPNSISVLTADFLKDLAITDFFGAVDYGVGVENIYNGTGVFGAPVGAASSNQVLVRGIASLRQLRDGFVWFVPEDAYNIDRIEFNRGPGGTAYGDVDPVGVLNISTKRPVGRRFANFAARYDNFGTRRFTLDVNQPLPERLSVRVNAVNSDVEKSRQRADTMQRAYAGAVRWRPFKDGRTQIDVSFERGSYRLNLAALQLEDGISAYIRGSGTNALDANPNSPGVQVNGVGMAQIAPATGNLHSFLDIGGTLYDMKSTATTTYRNSTILTGATVASGADPQNPLRLPLHYISFDITPYGKDWGGPQNVQDTSFRTYNIEVTQKIGDHLSLLLAQNGQSSDNSQESTFSGSAVLGVNSRTVFIDVNRVLPNPAVPGGTIPNPRFEQLFVGYIPVYITNGARATGWRTSGVYDANLPYQSTLRLVGGASYRREQLYGNRFGYSLTLAEMARRGITGAAATYTNNVVNPVHYLADGNSDEALALRTLPGAETWYRTSAASNTRYDQTLGAANLNAIGSFFRERLHTTAGVNREYFRQNRANAPVADSVGELHFVDLAKNVISNTGNYDVPYGPFNKAYSTNYSYGGVLRVLPWMSVSAGYFESSLFTESISSDLAGAPALPHKGTGHDYSVRFNLLRDRVDATLTRFDTVAKNNVLALSAGSVTELNRLLPANQQLVGTGDYRDQSTEGWEFELQSNLSPHWTLRATYSVNWTTYTRFYPLVRSYLATARTAATARGLDPDNATLLTQQLIDSTEGAAGNVRRETANVVSRYQFTEGRVKGLNVGLGARYVLGHPLAALSSGGQVIYPATSTGNYVLLNPFLSYRRKLFGLYATVQLNVNNVLDRRSDQTLTQQNLPFYTEPRQYISTFTVEF